MATTTKNVQPWKDEGLTKPEWIAREVAKAVNAGKAWDLETVDFSDPNRPLTCLEVDFPIIPINQIAVIEGNAGKPIYQMSKWWARRRSSVFRSMLLAAAIKAPDDPAEAAKLVWNVYYGNHQKKGTFKHLKVADIFMGGGTTVVEGSRLGMQMYGNDLNPVAWFVVKNELAQVDKAEVEALLAEIEAEVKPQIMPFYACDCPRGHKGKWTQLSTSRVMGKGFDPLALSPEERKDYCYEGPEVIYTFWAKHGPCPVTGCGHRTPIMSSPVVAVKSISIKAWDRTCKHCGERYDIEECDARMAPGVELVVADTEHPYAVAALNMAGNPEKVTCPHCDNEERLGKLSKSTKKTVELSLLVHPDWLKGSASSDEQGRSYGGSLDDPVDATARWDKVRAATCRLVEVRGTLPPRVVLQDGLSFATGRDGGTIPAQSAFMCGACGTQSDILTAVSDSKRSPAMAGYAYQGYCPECAASGVPYGGRFFASCSDPHTLNAAVVEGAFRRQHDLRPFIPTIPVPEGFKTSYQRIQEHGYPTFAHMFSERQLYGLALIMRELVESAPSRFSEAAVLQGLGCLQQYLRNQNLFCLWNIQADKLEPHFSTNNYYPKNTPVENSVFSVLGRGNWKSCAEGVLSGLDWLSTPWEVVPTSIVADLNHEVAKEIGGKSVKALIEDRPLEEPQIVVASSTDLAQHGTSSLDLVITDPPFGNNVQYAELADFFHVWLELSPLYRRLLGAGALTPKSLEAVVNPVRNAQDPQGFYAKTLTAIWREAARVLKPAGILAFTFHHSEDRPWVSVLESLFEAGFILECAYPIRSDETKGEGAKPGTFGSQLIEYDVIHVCRTRQQAPTAISWAKLRRQVLQDVQELQDLLEHHQKDGLPEADVQVIRRGKALEYFSRHYGKVYKDLDTPMTVLEALLGINQLLDEEAGGIKEPPPHNAEPFTRMLLRLFDGKAELPRDQIQKFLRGTGSAPSDFEGRGWITEKKKIFQLVPPLELARQWIGKQRRGMTSDYDQAMFFIGACFESSGINASETLNNPNFRPHPALGAILAWFKTHGADSPTRNAATIASQLYKGWEAKNQPKAKELTLFDDLGEEV
ncbi:MAG: DUF1156 domain-containing protein [Phycisphaerales bacterium]|nr:DUF1156 domain-containing protein [Phycisphaerales bacterium]